jgi:hypothetical protein
VYNVNENNNLSPNILVLKGEKIFMESQVLERCGNTGVQEWLPVFTIVCP